MSDVPNYMVWICHSEERAQLIADAEKFINDVPFIERMFEALADKGKLTEKQETSLRNIVMDRMIWGNEQSPSESRYVGEVGMRHCFAGRVFKSQWKDGHYGTYLVTNIVTDDGNIVTYMGTANNMHFIEDTRVELVAEVDDHNLFRNAQTTRIKRPTVLEISEVEISENGEY